MAEPIERRRRAGALRWLGRLVAIGMAGLGGLVGAAWWASRGWPELPEVTEQPMCTPATDAPEPAGSADTLRVLVWNIGYGRGARDDDSGPWSRRLIEESLEGVARTIVRTGADVVMLQEVDRDADRSGRIDQARWLLQRLGWTSCACVDTWKVRYVPYPYWPPSRHYGRMWSGQCVLSRLPLRHNVRHALPQPASRPFWYRWFYLHRALQTVEVRTPSGWTTLVNVHLEAFDRVNRRRHANILAALMTALRGRTVVVAGDFNALPPEARRQHGFADEPEADFRGDDTLAVLRAVPGYREVHDPDAAIDGPQTWTFPAWAPTRRLDHVFVSEDVASARVTVVHDAWRWSDHLPLLLTMRPGPRPGSRNDREAPGG